MTSTSNDDDDMLDIRYRHASEAQSAAPSEAVRAAILAEGRRVATERRGTGATSAIADGGVAANDQHWSRARFATLAAALITALIIVPLYREPPVIPLSVRVADEAPASGVPSSAITLQSAPADGTVAALTVPTPPTASTSMPDPEPRPRAPAANIRPQATAPSVASLDGAAESSRDAGSQRATLAEAAAAPAVGLATAPTARLAKAAAPPTTDTADADLRAAVIAGDADRVRLLVGRGASVAQSGDDGRSPLLLATAHGQLEIVRLLLARGADPNAADRSGRTPLAEARAQRLDEIATELKRAGGR